MIPIPLGASLSAGSVPAFLNDIDPTYFLFRTLRCIPQRANIRVLLGAITILHSCNLVMSFIVYLVNATLPILCCLKFMTNQSLDIMHQSCRTSQFVHHFRKYRQLQILIRVENQVLSYVLSLALVGGLLSCCAAGYLLVKLSTKVPLPLTLLAACFFLIIIASAHFLFPIASNICMTSRSFLRLWKLQKMSTYRRNQLRSCTLLRISVGRYFFIEREARTTFISLLLYYTVTLVISV